MEGRIQENASPPLHIGRVEQRRAAMNRVRTLVHCVGVIALLYYRASSLFSARPVAAALAWALLFISELLLSFLWLLGQPFRWRPFSRTVFPERLPDDTQPPAIDVFICTADPKKEPPVEVMNTVLSAMSLDYPPEKLAVYLSDDAGSPITLNAIRQAFSFARFWLPFCRKNGVQCRCPGAYFSTSSKEFHSTNNAEFLEEREKIKIIYENFKEDVERPGEIGVIGDRTQNSPKDHPPLIEVIHENQMDSFDKDQSSMPLLVYVRREKRSTHPHHFKAGALNVLLRVSSIMTNAPYILVLDCDMYSNDPTSARQAMCFLLDPNISHSVAFIQFPQTFHNISKNDIYDSQIRYVFQDLWKGLDGLQGPMLSGTGFYIKREALYGTKPSYSMREELESTDLLQFRECFGPSNELIAAVRSKFKGYVEKGIASSPLTQEAGVLASCSYEKDTKWGEEIGFFYHSLVEDVFTGFRLHCRGWTSIYYKPSIPSFLGSAPIILNDYLIQNKRWASGLLEIGLSRFCPLTYGLSRKSILQNMCYSNFTLQPLNSIPILCYVTIPQLCLLNGVSLFPKVSSAWFLVFLATYISSLYQHLLEVISSGGSIKTWWNEHRIWHIRAATSNLFGCLDVIMKWVGIREVKFDVTDKVADEEQIQRYEMGIFDFQGTTLLIVPLVILAIINLASSIGGIVRVIAERSLDEMFVQILLSFFILITSYPIFEGVLVRKDKGRIPTIVTLISVIFSMILLSLGYFTF